MRRYSLTCMFGLEEEDDDGNLSAQPTDKLDNSAPEKAGTCKSCGKDVIKRQIPR